MQQHVICGTCLLTTTVESFSDKPTDGNQTYESFNLQHIKRFLVANSLLQIIFEPKPQKQSNARFTATSRRLPTARSSTTDSKPTHLLTTIQVLCAPMLLSFEPHLESHHYSFPDSQYAVYSTPSVNAIFHGTHGLDINMEFILHNINFWKYHMIREVEGTLFYPFQDLEPDERPRWWSPQPMQGGPQKLGKHWKGSYAYIDRPEMEIMRRSRREVSDQIQDNFAGEETAFSFQDMRLELASNDQDFPWPTAFERHLRSLSPPPSRAKTRAQKRCATPDAIANFKPQSFRFDGEGQDVTEQFLASGWLNPLPPQSGVPGWQRMTMMKYFEDENDVDGIDVNALWAYEGVVLPGGQIMLGRWWSPSDEDEMYSGPFILWCVDGPKYDVVEMEEEGMEWRGETGQGFDW